MKQTSYPPIEMSNHAKKDISPKKEEKSSEITKMLKEKKI